MEGALSDQLMVRFGPRQSGMRICLMTWLSQCCCLMTRRKNIPELYHWADYVYTVLPVYILLLFLILLTLMSRGVFMAQVVLAVKKNYLGPIQWALPVLPGQMSCKKQ